MFTMWTESPASSNYIESTMATHHPMVLLPIIANLLYVSVAKMFPLYMHSSSVLDLQVIWLSYGNVSLFTMGN